VLTEPKPPRSRQALVDWTTCHWCVSTIVGPAVHFLYLGSLFGEAVFWGVGVQSKPWADPQKSFLDVPTLLLCLKDLWDRVKILTVP
jgi:hypothetical protein